MWYMCDDVGEGAKMQLVVTPEAPALLQCNVVF